MQQGIAAGVAPTGILQQEPGEPTGSWRDGSSVGETSVPTGGRPVAWSLRS